MSPRSFPLLGSLGSGLKAGGAFSYDAHGRRLDEADFTHLLGGGFISPSRPVPARSTTFSPRDIPGLDQVARRHPRDPVYCLEQVRSARFCQARDEGREQVNTATAFVDASLLYGNDVATAEALRAGKDGALLATKHMLPDKGGRRPAGDPRVHETPGG